MSNCSGVLTTDPIIKYVPIHDTVLILHDRIVNHTDTIYYRDSLVAVDLFVILDNDTFAILPVEYKEYRDTIVDDCAETKIDIKYHGIGAEIDLIALDHKYNKEIQTIYLPPKKWNIAVTFGPYVGFGVHGNIQLGTFGYGPEIGVGISVGVSRTINLHK